MNNISLSIQQQILRNIAAFFSKNMAILVVCVLSLISVGSYIFFYKNGLGLAYNDARSHLDIGRRVVEGLKPGLAQLGSVWLPLPHLLMVPTIWNDFMWHSGLSGALQSMIAFVATGYLIYAFLRKLGVGMLGRLVGVLVWVANVNTLYLQSTAMTELLLLGSMTAGVYYLFLWQKDEKLLNLVKSSFWIMLATLNRYDGWFLLVFATFLIGVITLKKYGFKKTEGLLLFFITLSGLGIALWFLWNQLIFKDALYFALGPYSAHAQQQQLASAGDLPTKRNLLLSTSVYLYALIYNTGFFTLFLGTLGALLLFWDKTIKGSTRIILLSLFAPFLFNILALYLGFSVLFVQGISGDTWFNVRYGIMMAPSIAIFIGYLVHKAKTMRFVFIGLLILTLVFSLAGADAVTIDDARVGSSQKNVTEVSNWLAKNAANKPGYVLISAASHDAIIFSSGLPMSKFIHEGTGAYWTSATTSPDRWARWIIMRTNDVNDQTFKLVRKSAGFKRYNLVGHYPFADIYEIKPEYVSQLHTTPILGKQK
ncbi:MAG TPA: hypothetical protein VEW42_01550 [Candidatus Eisenbacteria bacterium]|nr:hypothetical protein [Candidatus Eisenbacteria bacterium]